MPSSVDSVAIVSRMVANVDAWPCVGLTVKSAKPFQMAPWGSPYGTFLAASGCRRSSSTCILGICVPFA